MKEPVKNFEYSAVPGKVEMVSARFEWAHDCLYLRLDYDVIVKQASILALYWLFFFCPTGKDFAWLLTFLYTIEGISEYPLENLVKF